MHENWTHASDWAGIQIQVRVNLYMMAAAFLLHKAKWLCVGFDSSKPCRLHFLYRNVQSMMQRLIMVHNAQNKKKKVLMPVGKKCFEQMEQSAWLCMQKLRARSTCTLIRMPTLVANSAATCNEQHRSGRVGRKRNKNVTERVERVRVTTPIHLTLDWSCRRRTMFRVLGSDWPSDLTNRKGVWAQEWSTCKKR